MARCLSILLLLLVLLFSSCGAPAGEKRYEFDIEPQLLETALTTFSKTSDYQFIYTDASIASLKTGGVKGFYSAGTALEKLLKGTGVTFKYTNENTILLDTADSVSSRVNPTPAIVARADNDAEEAGGVSNKAAAEQEKTMAFSHSMADEYVVPERHTIDEIIVTALKRKTSLQDTPISITVLTEKNLERLGADDFLDFIGSVPGLNVRDNGPGQTRPIIRGIFSPGEPQVGVYFDDAIITGAPGTTNSAGRFSAELKPFDIERIEILKGPQGTLYGGGSMGGTIRFITEKPNASEFESKFSIEGSTVRYGSAGYQVNGMVNLPIIQDQLALRMVAYKRDDSGYVDNVALDKDDINDIDTEGGRVALRWTPVDNFTATGTVFYQNQKVGGGFHFNPDLGKKNPKTGVGSNEPFDDEYVLYNLTFEYRRDWVEALYSCTYYDRNAVFRFYNNFSGIPFPPLLAVQPQPTRAQTHELRFSSTGQKALDWTIGAFYQDRLAFTDSRVTRPTTAGNEPDPVVFFFRRTAESSLIQRALFGEVSWHVNQKFDVTAGIRYFDIDNGSDVVNIFGVYNTPLLPQRTNITRGSDDGPVFKLHAGYHFADDILLFAQFSQGFRPGGANQNNSSIAITDPLNVGVPESFDSDEVDNYEFGFRTAWFDKRLILNGAIFHMDWSDIVLEHRSPTGLFTFLDNADSAEVDGAEVELMFNALRNLRLTAALAYLDAELTSNGPVNRQQVSGLTLSRSGLKGDAIPNVPAWTINMSLDYEHELPWLALTGMLYVNVEYTGESFSDYNQFLLDPLSLSITSIPNVNYNKQGDYTVVDVKVGLESKNDWSVYLYVENLLDKRGITHVFEDGNFRLEPGLNFFERPRTVGLILNKTY